MPSHVTKSVVLIYFIQGTYLFLLKSALIRSRIHSRMGMRTLVVAPVSGVVYVGVEDTLVTNVGCSILAFTVALPPGLEG